MKISESKIILIGYVILLAIGVPLAFGIELVEEIREASEVHVVGGLHDVMLSENAIVEDINRAKRQITVKMLDQENAYDGEENPYDSKRVVLEYTHDKDFYISGIEVSDEVVFRHFYYTPYEIESIKKMEE